MKKQIIISAVFLLSLKVSFAQYVLKSSDDVSWYTNIAQEEIYVHHNSNLLFSGEYLYYKVTCLNSKNSQFSNNSKIAYVELIGENGSIFKHKIRLEDGLGQGEFFIPTSVSSGNYKLISYTQWMKNRAVDEFFVSDITIINPYAKINFTDTATVTDVNRLEESVDNNQIRIRVDANSYGVREEVHLKIESLNSMNAFGKYSVSVRKIDAIPNPSQLNTATTYKSMYKNSTASKSQPVGSTILLPEFKGEMISGRVTNKASGNPVEKIKVAFSILSDEAYQDISLTDVNGTFYFQLSNDYSQSQALVQILDKNKSDYQVTLNQHESIDYSNLEYKEFEIHSKFKDAILERSVNNQIQNAYEAVRQDQIISPVYPKPFYGNNEVNYVLDDYKRFSNVAETLIEVVDNAWHERGNEKKRFVNIREHENDPYYEVDILPMLVVDGALVQDHETLLYYEAKNVESISVFRDEFYYGDIVYQGALMVNTFDKNYYTQFLGDDNKILDLFSPQLKVNYFNQSYTKESDSDRIPDFRTQLLWMPNFQLKTNIDEISFFTSDNKGTYLIEFEGFTNSGNPISIKKSFTVN